MSILRLPGTRRPVDATQLATEDDLGVTGHFFSVEVRPWQVMFTA